MMVFTASLLQTSLFRHWQAKSWTFWMLIMSHLFSCCPQSFAWEGGERTGSGQTRARRRWDGGRVPRRSPHRLKAPFVHELNRRTEEVCQGAQFLVHCTVTQLLLLTNYNKNVPLGREAAGQKEAERIYLPHLLVSVWKSLKPSKMDRAGLLRFGTAEQKKKTMKV